MRYRSNPGRIQVRERYDSENPGKLLIQFNKIETFHEWFLKQKKSKFTLKYYREERKKCENRFITDIGEENFNNWHSMKIEIQDEIVEYLHKNKLTLTLSKYN